MANRRKSKTVLGQTPVEEKKVVNVAVSDKDVEMVKELHDVDIVEEAKKMAAEEAGIDVDDVIVEIIETPEAPEQPEEPIEEVKVEAPKLRKVSDLNEQEYRYYMNTGIIPQ
jgi:hypothetical protein